MRRFVLALSLAAFVVAGCGPLTEMISGDEGAPEESHQQEVAPTEETPESEAGAEDPAPATETALDGEWNEAVRTNFYDACLGSSGDASGYCQCALEGFEETFSQSEFEAMEQEMVAADVVPPEFDEVVQACIEQHQDELGGATDESADGEWSSLAQSEFLTGCVATSVGMSGHCECALDGMQETFTESEFTTLSLGLGQGEQVPPEFDEVIGACLEQHG